MSRTAERLTLGLVGAGLVAAIALLVIEPRIQANKAALLGKGDYQLETTEGTPFTEATLKGAPSAVFFGFTHCPDVCPTTMGDIALWKQDLPQAEDLKVYFVTVDPARDSLDQLRGYTSWIPGVTGVTGPPQEVRKALSSFDIFANRVDLGNGEYTMDHTSYVMLFDAQGLFVEEIPYQSPAAEAEDKLRNLLAGNPEGRGARMPSDLIGQICYTLQDKVL
ncbi:SCO family protein [Pseudooceanicola sp. CBS1P-1]|uniref:SCO family protein n=1 Tax=Pseudooceanicola albus TaxID=2692189 RepID=A0A6L7G9Z7_9RHOB|nr:MULTISPECIES: SCO family protein [Pseudooceanicola]MBT9386006.1 SCO family protein [Pseudooceanicola endophyticus]MXN19573.1 SCO family protein [Pseudooceanicola albus]